MIARRGSALVAALVLACTYDAGGVGAHPEDMAEGTSTSTTSGEPPAITGAPTTTTSGGPGETTEAAVTGVGPTSEATTTTGEPGTTAEPCAPELLYVDDDGDGFGDTNQPVMECPGPGLTPQPGDCDDAAAEVFPGRAEACNVVDDDCDEQVDEFDLRSNIACGPCTYILAAGRLYAFCSGAYDWSEARADCQQRGLDLAIEVDWAEHDLLVSYLAMNSGQWYLGGHDGDNNNEGQWKWIDGTSLAKNDGRFGPMQPDNKGSSDGGADCLALVGPGGGNNQKRWVDENCDVPHKWICEGPPPP